MAGRRARYEGSTGMNSLNYFGLSIVAAGMVNPPEDGGYETLATFSPAEGRYRKLVLKQNRIVGMILAGDIERAGIIFGLMREGINVGRFKEALLARDFGLAALPEELRWRRLPAPPPGLRTGGSAPREEVVVGE